MRVPWRRGEWIAVVGMIAACSSGGGNGNDGCSGDDECPQGQVCSLGTCRPAVQWDSLGGGDTSSEESSAPEDTTTGGSASDTEGPASDTGSVASDTAGVSSDTVPECTRNVDCDDQNECTDDWCDPSSFTCVHQAKPDTTPCTDDGLFCTGKERCMAGQCVGQNPCVQPPAQYACAQTAMTCNEATRSCETADVTPVADGTPCSEPLFCAGGATKECRGGVCVPPEPDDPCDAMNSDCAVAFCNETADACDLTPVHIGETCLEQGDACKQGVCLADGTCDWKDPCVKNPGNPCIDEYCTDGGTQVGDYTCHTSVAPNGTSCVKDGDACMGPPTFGIGYCWQVGDIAACIQPEDRPCYDFDPDQGPTLCGPLYRCNNALAPDLCESVGSSAADVVHQVDCGSVTTFANTDFLTRHYYDYGASCAGDFRGMELVLQLPDAAFSSGPRAVTVTADGDTPDQSLQVLHLSDVCSPTSCTAVGADTLTATMQAGDVIIVEAEPGYPPAAVDISITCN